jgi:hypothetical protein
MNDKELLEILKVQSEAMMKMNERIAILEDTINKQQYELEKLTESLPLTNEDIKKNEKDN